MSNQKLLRTAINALISGDQQQAEASMKGYIAAKSADILADMQSVPDATVIEPKPTITQQ